MKDVKWLEELKAQIIEDRDKENFNDLIKCYENGILRAGFVMAWLMLVESLKRKVVELADKEVKVAVKERENIQKVEDAMRSNDEVTSEDGKVTLKETERIHLCPEEGEYGC